MSQRARRRHRVSQSEPTEAARKNSGAEIQEEADVAAGEFQIGEHLRVVNFEERIDGFQFNNDEPGDEEVEAVDVIDDQIFIGNGAEFLLFEDDAAKTEFVGQGALIR